MNALRLRFAPIGLLVQKGEGVIYAQLAYFIIAQLLTEF